MFADHVTFLSERFDFSDIKWLLMVVKCYFIILRVYVHDTLCLNGHASIVFFAAHLNQMHEISPE